MLFVKAKPNEYLVVGQKGKITNRGAAASAFLWLGSTYVLIPSTQQEANFAMTQESKDGIPLRFKGIVIYRVSNPETAAKRFNFASKTGLEEINDLISHVCLGELRDIVSHMTMQECIEQRKTTLTDAVAAALAHIVHDQPQEQGWGIDLDVVQVAQVFIVDNELRRQLEAEVRNQLKSTSDLSDIKTQEAIQLAQSSSARRLQQEHLEAEREHIHIEQEKLRLQKTSEQEAIEVSTPVKLLNIEKQSEVLKQELEMRQLENQVRELEIQKDLMLEKAKHELRKEILPIEQVPEIAAAVSRMFQGANLSFYGEASPLLTAIAPIVELLAKTLRERGILKPSEGNKITPDQKSK
jgi:hypothetical protein